MAQLPGEEPVSDDKIVYRRIPLDWCVQGIVKIEAFKPGKLDTTGLSVSRAKYKDIADAARNSRGKQYFVAVLKVGSLRENGIEVVPRPGDPNSPEYDPSHAELPQLTYEQRHSNESLEFMEMLATSLCRDVKGPYP